MSKIIKKKLKRSLPWLTIITLVSSLAVGLSFNLDFQKLVKTTVQEGGLNLPLNQAQADLATTSVTVQNAPPEITNGPAEDPVSTSTSPINLGDQIGFRATGNDPENNNYYLIVCTTNDVTPGPLGVAPSCGGVQLCVSDLTGDTVEAVCYHTVTDPPAESRDWYGFICDNHASEADCSPANQGSGDSGSPFFINHAPLFDDVNTTVDSQAPGGTFTVVASTTDYDIQGGNDEQHLYVCLTNSWATSTGCAIELCHGTSTAPVDPSCSFSTTTVAVDDTYNYYAFVMDWHNMPSAGNPQTGTYTVINVAPFVTNIILNNSINIQPNLKYAPEYEASSTFQVSDYNSCLDIVSATGTIYWESATNGFNCTADDDDCYQILSTSCAYVSGTCADATDATADYTCTTTIAFHAQPTDALSNQAVTAWFGAASAADELLHSTTSVSSAGVDVATNSGLDVQEPEIAYGAIKGAQNSQDQNGTTTVENYGNSPINVDVSGVNMLRDGGGGTLDVFNQVYGLDPFTYPLASYYLYSTTTQEVDITAPKPVTGATDVEDDIYWGIGIPGGTPSGDYYGSNTIAVRLDGSGW